MAVHKISKGLDLPISGRPLQVLRGATRVTRVAVMADDFPGMKPGMKVSEGDTVKRGQPLFEDRKTPGVIHTAPGAGRVIGVYRGARRALQSVVVDLSDSEREGQPREDEFQRFESYSGRAASDLDRDAVQALLIESGLWTALRRRPFERSADPASPPAAVFVNAMDTNPLAPLPEIDIERRRVHFDAGLELVAKLTNGPTFLCVHEEAGIEVDPDTPVRLEHFSGPHPSGTVGVHIHTLLPASRARTVWHIGYQDVIAVGELFATGRLPVERLIAIGGPVVDDPRLLVSRVGASIDDVLQDIELKDGELRHISGSVFSGKKAMGEIFGFTGRFDLQVSVLAEDREKEFIGWLMPGVDSFSVIPIYVSNVMQKIFGKRRTFDMTTSTNGSIRAMVPIGLYEDVMPMDILPTFLLRSLLVGDIERAEQLGCLELAEEDVALCTFVCPGKMDYGPILRRNLEMIEKDGMKFLKDLHENAAPLFEKGGKLELLYPIYEAQYTGLFTPGTVTKTASHVRDGLDLKRMMITVVVALVPCILFGSYNIGYQAALAIAQGAQPMGDLGTQLYMALGGSFDFRNPLLCMAYGVITYLPIFVAAFATGAIIEPLFAIIRKHEINEGFLVTGMLIPLTLPPTMPLWMIVLGTAFGVVIGKEIFGGTGMNFLNPALTARAFLFFAYPAAMSGDAAWIAADFSDVDSFSGATLLAQAAVSGPAALEAASYSDAFFGFIAGSVGETSAFMALIGAAILLWTKVGSHRTMLGVAAGTIFMATLLNVAGSETNPMFGVPWYWHMAIGSWAFGTVFMATDPVSSAFTNRGKWIYGAMIGVLVVLIRVVNPAYPEGMMLAILFMNMFAPLIDHFVVQANIQRRLVRSAV